MYPFLIQKKIEGKHAPVMDTFFLRSNRLALISRPKPFRYALWKSYGVSCACLHCELPGLSDYTISSTLFLFIILLTCFSHLISRCPVQVVSQPMSPTGPSPDALDSREDSERCG